MSDHLEDELKPNDFINAGEIITLDFVSKIEIIYREEFKRYLDKIPDNILHSKIKGIIIKTFNQLLRDINKHWKEAIRINSIIAKEGIKRAKDTS